MSNTVTISKDLGLFRHIESYEYKPTPEELLYWYSGTSGSFTRDNPYAPKNSSMTKVKFVRVKE